MKKHSFRDWMIAIRPWSFPASTMPIIVTLAYLFWKGAAINWYYGAWALVNMVLFHIAGNVWSDYHDYKKGVDREDTTGAKALVSGMFLPEELKRFAIKVLLVAVAGGIGLVALTGLPLLWTGIAGAALTLLYPATKYRALGDINIFLTFAVLPTLGTSFIATGAIDWSVLWIVVPAGLITVGILHSNNTRDMVQDKRAEISTLAMKIGRKASARIYAFEVIFPFIWVAACSITGLLPLSTIIIFLTLPIAMGCSRTMMKSITGGNDIIADLDVRTANLQLLYSLLFTLAFVLDRLI